MPSVQHLREFITERLTAAAEEIFSEFEKTIVRYEEEIDRQRRLLDITWRPEIKLRRTDIPQQHVCKQEVLTEQQLCNQERSSNLLQEEPEPPQITDEPCHQEGRQFDLKEETDTFFKVIVTYEDSSHSEVEPDREQFPCHSSPVAERQDQEGSKNVDLGSTGNGNRSDSNYVEDSPTSVDQLNTDLGTKSSKCDGFSKRKRRKAFKKKSQMRIHHRIRAGEKLHTCKTCAKSFTRRSSLLRHKRIHTGEKSHSCQTCGKAFSHSTGLVVHMRIHTGERPYSCKTCGKSFNQLGHLMAHMRIHTGEKPFSCRTCGKTFSQSSHLLNHLRTHTGEKPYVCETCRTRFSDRSSLKLHKTIHTGVRPHSCQTCWKTFATSSNLLRPTAVLSSSNVALRKTVLIISAFILLFLLIIFSFGKSPSLTADLLSLGLKEAYVHCLYPCSAFW